MGPCIEKSSGLGFDLQFQSPDLQVGRLKNWRSAQPRRFFETRTPNPLDLQSIQVKFIYSEKATKFCEIFTLLLTGTTQDKSKVKISENFVAFSEYVNFKKNQSTFEWTLVCLKLRLFLFGCNEHNCKILPSYCLSQQTINF